MMKKKSRLTAALIGLSIVLIGAGAVMAAQSQFMESDTYDSQMKTPELSIALLENGKEVSGDDVLLQNMLGEDATIKIGKIYDEKLAISNTDDTDQYVRLTVRKYWLDGEDGKRVDLSPELINLRLGKNWIEDKNAAKNSSPETTVLYYTKPLKGGEDTTPAVTGVGLDVKVAKYMEMEKTETQDGNTFRIVYDYDGLTFGIEADADGIQTHHAEDAAKSAWGVDVTVSDNGTLKLK